MAENTRAALVAASQELLARMVQANGAEVDDLASVLFTVTPDLDACYPAAAAHEMGWARVPLLCQQEMRVPGSLPRCLRVLMLWNTDKSAGEIRHVYLGEAAALRPDLAQESRP